jgi:hypothetical protein
MTQKSDSYDGATPLQLIWSWLSLFCVLAVLVLNVGWTGDPSHPFVDHRLQAYLTPKEKVVAGSRLKPEQLEAQWKWFTEAECGEVVGVATNAAGRYASKDIVPNAPIMRSMVSETPPVEPSGMFVVVPVEVKAAYATAMHPGLRLAFTKDSTFLPTDLPNQNQQSGYALRTIAPIGNPGTEALFFIEVPLGQIGDIRSLVEGIWTPLVPPDRPMSSPHP